MPLQKSFIRLTPGANVIKILQVFLTMLFLGLKYHGKLLCYLSLPPWANVIKLFTMVILCHSVVNTTIILFYNTEWQQNHGMAMNYHSIKFYNIGPRCQCLQDILSSSMG